MLDSGQPGIFLPHLIEVTFQSIHATSSVRVVTIDAEIIKCGLYDSRLCGSFSWLGMTHSCKFYLYLEVVDVMGILHK